MSVKLNYSSKYFIQNNSECNSNPYFLVLQESPAKYGLLPFKFPKVTYRDTELSNWLATYLFSCAPVSLQARLVVSV